jgi:hypothetical protein
VSKPARHLKLVTAEADTGQGPPETLPGTGFAWACRKPVTEKGQPRECGASGSDRAEYERHMRGHGLKTAKSAYTPPKPWKPPRPKDYAPGPTDPGQRIEWQHAGDDGETRTVTGVIWSPADRPNTWWAQPDEDPAHPVYVMRYRYDATLHQVDRAAESARENIARGNIIRQRGIYAVLMTDSAGEPCARWHSDPDCPAAAGKERYDPTHHGRVCDATCDGYRPWTALDVARKLAGSFGRKPPWMPMCPDCVTNLDVQPPAEPGPEPGAEPAPGPEPEPAAAPVPPVTPDPVDAPGQAEPRAAAPEPAATSPAAARPGRKRRVPVAVRLDQPGTDAGFLASCAQLREALASLADDVGEWAGGLAVLGLPAPVTGPLTQLAGSIAGAAAGAAQAAAAFEDEFAGARDIAARGMQFTGRPRG